MGLSAVLADAKDGVLKGYEEGVNFQSDFVGDVAAYKNSLDAMGLSEKIGHYAGVAAGELVNIFTFGAVAYNNMYSLPSDVKLAGRIDPDVDLDEPTDHSLDYFLDIDGEGWDDVDIDDAGNVVLFPVAGERAVPGRRRYFARGETPSGRRARGNSELEANVANADVDILNLPVVRAPIFYRVDERDKVDLDNYVPGTIGSVSEEDSNDPYAGLSDDEAVKMYWADAFEDIARVENAVFDAKRSELSPEYVAKVEDAWNVGKILKEQYSGDTRTEKQIEADRSIAYQAKMKLVDSGKATITEDRGLDRFGIPIIRISDGNGEYLPEEGR